MVPAASSFMMDKNCPGKLLLPYTARGEIASFRAASASKKRSFEVRLAHSESEPPVGILSCHTVKDRQIGTNYEQGNRNSKQDYHEGSTTV